MLKRYSQVLAAVALAWLGGSANAQQPCATGACDAGCPTACSPATPNCGGFYGSAGILFLKACGNNNDAYSSFDCTYVNANPIQHTTNVFDFENGPDVGYRFEIGYSTGCGWGARLRYFNFETNNTVNAIDNLDDQRADSGATTRIDTLKPLGLQFSSFGSDINPTFLTFTNQIHVKIWDLEVTRSTRCGCLDLTGSLGVRYLQLYQQYNAFETLGTIPATPEFDQFGNDVTPIRTSQFLISSHSMNGWGPTLGLEARTTLWDNLRLYGQGRIGFIFCEGRQQAFKTVNFDPDRVPTDLPNPDQTAATARYNRMITTTEVEVGLEYAHQLCSGSEVYLRAGVIGMVFGGAGNNSRSAVGAGTGEDTSDNLSLFGLNFSVGIRY